MGPGAAFCWEVVNNQDIESCNKHFSRGRAFLLYVQKCLFSYLLFSSCVSPSASFHTALSTSWACRGRRGQGWKAHIVVCMFHLMMHFVLVRMVLMVRMQGTVSCMFHLMTHFVLVRMVFMQRTKVTIKWELHLMMHFALVRMVFMQRKGGIIKWRSFLERNRIQ